MRKILSELFRFLWLAVGGLTLDLALFSFGIWLGLSVFFANLLSSGLALLAVYHLAVNQVFRTDGSWFRLVTFFSWYAFSIGTFSFLAEWLHTNTAATEIESKLAIISPSFLSNFFAVRALLRFPKLKAISETN